MSSSYVRTQIKTFLNTTFPSENFIDLTAEFEELNDLLDRNGIGLTDTWVGLQFIGDEEEPITVDATPDQGCFREAGAVYLHVVDRSKLGVGDLILARSESFRNALRSKRIGDIVIERVSPPNFERGATLDFAGGYTSASIIISYHRDLNL